MIAPLLFGILVSSIAEAGGARVLPCIGALIDPVRTSTNVLCHCTAPPVIARWVNAAPSTE